MANDFLFADEPEEQLSDSQWQLESTDCGR